MPPSRISAPATKAEGLCHDIPYNTNLAGPNGCTIHFWMGDKSKDKVLLQKLIKTARYERDIVSVTFSDGAPTGIWGSGQNMPSD